MRSIANAYIGRKRDLHCLVHLLGQEFLLNAVLTWPAHSGDQSPALPRCRRA